MRSINPSLLVISILINLTAMRLGSFFLPDRMYFSFSSFLFETRDLNRPAAIIAKLLVPFFVAFCITLLLIYLRKLQQASFGPDKWAEIVLKDQVVITLSFATFFSVFLMAWPYILLWDMLISSELVIHRMTFLVAYIAYFFAASLFAAAGTNTAISIMTPRTDRSPITLKTLTTSSIGKPIFNALNGSFSAAISTLVALQVT